MFTGIIEDVGTLVRAIRSRNLATLTISTRLRGLRAGGSIAVDGACLTVVRVRPSSVVVEAARETLARTTLAQWTRGRRLNLERPLRVGSELGGHFVQGHVDAVSRILRVDPMGIPLAAQGLNSPSTRRPRSGAKGAVPGAERRVLRVDRNPKGLFAQISLPGSIRRYVVEKASIAIDGVSLTVNHVDRRSFSVYLIPFTLAHTTLASLAPGQSVNVETDLLARHAEKLLHER